MYEQLSLRLDCNETRNRKNIIKSREILTLDGEATLYSDFFNVEESDRFFQDLDSQSNWKQDYIRLYGKQIPLPRLTAWYGDEGKSYIYSGIKQHPDPWTSTLKTIKSRVEEIAHVRFNSVLLNLYRNGKDSVSWHSDDEPELGRSPTIASVSFGGTRLFCLKHKEQPERKIDVELSHGSLLMMKGETQHHWLHQIPKTNKNVKPRINLTFRVIQ